MATSDLNTKRAILLTTRLRFAPEVSKLKENALDSIVEQVLYCHGNGDGMTLGRILEVFKAESGGYVLNLNELRNSVKRLQESSKVERLGGDYSPQYLLTLQSKSDVEATLIVADREVKSVVNRLFKNLTGNPAKFLDAFMSALSRIFSFLGDQSINILKGDVTTIDTLPQLYIDNVIIQLKPIYPELDIQHLNDALISFFESNDPEYNSIKWNLSQNYYISKVLGLDPDNMLLSKELFAGSVLFLDTNILIEALEPASRHHETLTILFKACQKLGITLCAAQSTLEEFNEWVTIQKKVFSEVIDQIPAETMTKVDSLFIGIYLAKLKEGDQPKQEEIFANVEIPEHDLKYKFNIKIVKDRWFIDSYGDPKVSAFADILSKRYYMLRKRPKLARAAKHDAATLLWIKQQYTDKEEKAWFLTMDTSLPGAVPSDTDVFSLSITLDAIMQWFFPVLSTDLTTEKLSFDFAELLKSRMLPRIRLFEMQDFRIFNHMQMKCKNLPAKDVEACILYLKENAPNLDPASPKDRELLTYEVSKFFLDPSREFNQEKERLEQELANLRESLEKSLQKAGAVFDKMKQEHQVEIENQLAENRKMQHRLEAFEHSRRKRELRNSGFIRLIAVIVLLVTAEFVVGIVANIYAEGENTYQRLSASWEIFTSVFVLCTFFAWLWVGNKRLREMGQPFTLLMRTPQRVDEIENM